MSNAENLRERLYEKALNEQSDFVENLKHQPPEKIIDASYEKVMRDDILMTFENDDYYSDKQIKELLKFDYPLLACYNEWMDTDCSHMEMLIDTISNFANDLIKEQEKKYKKDEPER